ncbi:MAG TPA: cytochrome c [Planctomycetes bacterium]|nr:cytochrome c [Planctomycetota bacterium]
MNPTSRGYILAAVLAGVFVLVLHELVSADLSKRNWEAMTEMVYSKAGEPFARNDALPGGRTQQPVLEGVVVRGEPPLGFGPGPDEAERAGRELTSPIDLEDAGVLERGAKLFGTYCAVCHDGAGQGRGLAVMRGMLPPPPLTSDHARSLADGTLFHLLTFGQGNMASYAAQLSREERWQVIAHVRKLQGQGK